MSNQDITTHKFAAVLNRKVDIGKIMNALAHMSIGLAANATPEQKQDMGFIEYVDKDGNTYPNLSKNSYVILRADNANQIRTVRKQAKEKGIYFVAFSDKMQDGTYEEQLETIKEFSETEMEFVGICLFGPIVEVSELTRKFQLWH